MIDLPEQHHSCSLHQCLQSVNSHNDTALSGGMRRPYPPPPPLLRSQKLQIDVVIDSTYPNYCLHTDKLASSFNAMTPT